MNITLEKLKSSYEGISALCPYCGIESGMCMASISLFKTNSERSANYCHNENYDNCPIFLAKILRREMR